VITYKGRFSITIGDCWYAASSGPPAADIVHYYHLPEPLEGAVNQEFSTIWIDLAQPEDQLMAGMNKSTRHHVRKASEYGLIYDAWYPDTATVLDEFASFFDASASAKSMPLVNRESLRVYAAAGVLDLSRVSDREGRPLVWHGHYRDSRHARQTHTASIFRLQPDPEFRNFLGRANRYSCWQDIRRFKRAGVLTYDFGGWYPGTEDQELLAVNFFKEGFGGRIVKTFHATRGETPKGRLYLAAARLRQRFGRRGRHG